MTEYLKQSRTLQRQKLLFVYGMVVLFMIGLAGRLLYLMVNRADYYGEKAKEVHQRQRTVKAARGIIYDRNGVAIASNKPVSTISVIHNQVQNPEKVIHVLSELLELPEEKVRKRVEKVSSIEKIKSNVDKDISDRIRDMELAGVMVDEDYKRYYPYSEFASKVIGFTGADNQGIIGMEVAYDKYLQGQDGSILTMTTARGLEIDGKAEERIEPIAGTNLYTSLDVNIQSFAQQAAGKVMKAKKAKSVRIVMMNPQNGEIYAMVNVPEFDLNDPYTLNTTSSKNMSDKKKQEALNGMWRNACVSDTYEPGSTFKVIVAASALEAGVVKLEDTFHCPGFKVVEDRRIRCHKTTGHGSETFVQGVQNSCNPVFMEVGARLGVDNMFHYLQQLGIMSKTGIDVPGEASTIMHRKENVGAVELATMSFGQSFQLTPVRLLSSISMILNGGTRITPHLGVELESSDGTAVKKLTYPAQENIISSQTSETMRMILESVVSEGSGKKAYVEGYQVGAKTGTSEKLPRHSNKYIASCMGFAPADHPVVAALVLIDEPQGIYYGGTIAAPVISELLDNALPYLGVERGETVTAEPG
ncbi:peptidoglycan D,D-transpeptidase FtsI family protein [Jutongia huaianensis]|uniref:Peptidoglycan glycosyltransferase n=1 Tax=Jutongia huaianensis TaxID=2763668 RepID=A0ABR7N2W7_9FIRM|nr:penicillin-binding transpeptidase domain-containing protein [Jutongia huaianensis]MBC8562969.1 peptidoglycan glycosyltransferase [Jutongia huaianensis]